jgi:hypothetical protein
LPVGMALLARLRTLGEAVVGLAGLDVKSLQPRLNAIKRYALARKPSSEDELYASVYEPVFRGIADRYPHTGEFSVAATCEACEAAMAVHLGETVDALREGLRPTAARGGQGDGLAAGTDAASGSTGDDATLVGQGEQRELGPPAPDDLVQYGNTSYTEHKNRGSAVQLRDNRVQLKLSSKLS